MLSIEVLIEDKDRLGEGPLWDVEEQRLYWINSYGPPSIAATPPAATSSTGACRSRSARWRSASRAARSCRSAPASISSISTSGEVTRINETQPGELRPRLNDGKVDRQGRFVAGSMDFEERDGVGKLFRLDPDLSLHTLDTDIICSNGPCWSPDGRTFYFADTTRNVIYAYDYDTETGDVRSRRVFTTFDKLRGYPDGATVDEEGYVWSVEVYSGRLIRFDPEGVVDRIVGLPVQSTTSMIFGGADLDIVYVTSMARPMGNEYHREREAGCLFAIHGLGVRGLPEPRFAG